MSGKLLLQKYKKGGYTEILSWGLFCLRFCLFSEGASINGCIHFLYVNMRTSFRFIKLTVCLLENDRSFCLELPFVFPRFMQCVNVKQ